MPKVGTEAGTIPEVAVKPFEPYVPVPINPRALDIPFIPFVFPRMSGGGGAGAPSNQKYTYYSQKNRWVGDYSKLLSAVGARLYTPKPYKLKKQKQITFGRSVKNSKHGYTSMLSRSGLPTFKQGKSLKSSSTIFMNKKVKIKLR